MEKLRQEIRDGLQEHQGTFWANPIYDFTKEELDVLVQEMNTNPDAVRLVMQGKYVSDLEKLDIFGLKIDKELNDSYVVTDSTLRDLAKIKTSVLDLTKTTAAFSQEGFQSFLMATSPSLTYLKLPRLAKNSIDFYGLFSRMIEQGELPNLLRVDGIEFIGNAEGQLYRFSSEAEEIVFDRQQRIWQTLNLLREGEYFPTKEVEPISKGLYTMGILQPYAGTEFGEFEAEKPLLENALLVKHLIKRNRLLEEGYEPHASEHLIVYAMPKNRLTSLPKESHKVLAGKPEIRPLWFGEDGAIPKTEMVCFDNYTVHHKTIPGVQGILKETGASLANFGDMQEPWTEQDFREIVDSVDKCTYVEFPTSIFAYGEEGIPGYISWTKAAKILSKKLEEGKLPNLVAVEGIVLSDLSERALTLLGQRKTVAEQDLELLKGGNIPEDFADKKAAMQAVVLNQHYGDSWPEVTKTLLKVETLCPQKPRMLTKGNQAKIILKGPHTQN